MKRAGRAQRRVALGALAFLVCAGILTLGCATDPIDGHWYLETPTHRIDPVGAWRRGYQPRSLEEIRLAYARERPECGGDRVVDRLIWQSDCQLGEIACMIPLIAPRDPTGCALEDSVEQGLRDQGL